MDNPNENIKEPEVLPLPEQQPTQKPSGIFEEPYFLTTMPQLYYVWGVMNL